MKISRRIGGASPASSCSKLRFQGGLSKKRMEFVLDLDGKGEARSPFK